MHEQEQVARLLSILEQLPCIDSTLNVRVDFDTLAAFEGDGELVEDIDGDEDFYAKRVLETSGPVDDLGSGVTVELWAAPPLAPDWPPTTAGHTAPGR